MEADRSLVADLAVVWTTDIDDGGGDLFCFDLGATGVFDEEDLVVYIAVRDGESEGRLQRHSPAMV